MVAVAAKQAVLASSPHGPNRFGAARAQETMLPCAVIGMTTASSRRRARTRATAIRWSQVHSLALLKLVNTPTVIDRTSILRMRSSVQQASSDQLQLPRMALGFKEVFAERCDVLGGRGDEQQQVLVAIESPEDLCVMTSCQLPRKDL
jgi:hypothetical protein